MYLDNAKKKSTISKCINLFTSIKVFTSTGHPTSKETSVFLCLLRRYIQRISSRSYVTSCRSVQNLLNCKTDFQHTEVFKVARYDHNDKGVVEGDDDDDDDNNNNNNNNNAMEQSPS